MDGDPNLTAAYGAQEYWLLVNDSDECHNFQHPPDQVRRARCGFLGRRAAVRSPMSPRRSEGWPRRFNRNVLHDNYPLSPGARVLVMIKLDGPKLGRFVFHCHILEHEDKGMMATIGSWTAPAALTAAPGAVARTRDIVTKKVVPPACSPLSHRRVGETQEARIEQQADARVCSRSGGVWCVVVLLDAAGRHLPLRRPDAMAVGSRVLGIFPAARRQPFRPGRSGASSS